ncbi:MAG: hypothetical protein KBS81_11055 [Spirochaetales bacterium]|nr:hypothetical protein [Candidatus Physcosoma equi]
MTELLYYKDAYLKETEATVVEIRKGGVVLDKTIFYPECGGQPGDKGTFGPFVILDTQKDEDGTPLHKVEGTVLPSVGDTYTLALDWNHRYQYMKEHTAQHLLSATLFHEAEIGTVAVHQGEEILTIETERCDIPDETLLYIEDVANRHINENLKVSQDEMSHEKAEALGMRRSIKVDGDVKVVFIENLDAVACGGVHIARTGEIGSVVYRGKEMIRGHVRTIWSCSDAATSYRRTNEKAVKECGKLLSASAETLPSEVERLKEELTEAKREVKELRKALAEVEFQKKAGEEKTVILSTSLSAEDMLSAATSDSSRQVFIAEEGEKKGFLYYGTKENFGKMKAAGAVRGGGKDVLFRGTYSVPTDEILKIAREAIEN